MTARKEAHVRKKVKDREVFMDMRNPINRAWAKWEKSEEGRLALHNVKRHMRQFYLSMAFISGWEAAISERGAKK